MLMLVSYGFGNSIDGVEKNMANPEPYDQRGVMELGVANIADIVADCGNVWPFHCETDRKVPKKRVADLDDDVIDRDGVMGVALPLSEDLAEQQLSLYGADALLALSRLHSCDRLRPPGPLIQPEASPIFNDNAAAARNP